MNMLSGMQERKRRL